MSNIVSDKNARITLNDVKQCIVRCVIEIDCIGQASCLGIFEASAFDFFVEHESCIFSSI